MKKFTFPFERAMDWREKKAEQERQELHRLNTLHSTLVQRQAEVASAAHQAAASLAEASHVQSADLRTTAAFVSSLRVSAAELERLKAECRSQIEAQTKRCVSADRDYKLLARLRDQRLGAWHYEYQRETEQAATEIWQAGRTRQR
jgi:hypothetical protein